MQDTKKMMDRDDIFRALRPTRRDRDGAVKAPIGRLRRRAAVLCPVVEHQDGLSIMLTVRAAHLKIHAGQISFPGGKIDPSDSSPLSAALREADEEIGLPSHRVDILGSLDPYDTSTGFVVTPFVGMVEPAFQPILNEGEVAEVFEVPFDFVMDMGNHERIERMHDGRKRSFYQIVYGDYRIWGATAGMLRNLAERLYDQRGARRHRRRA